MAVELQSLLLGADGVEPFLVEVTRQAAESVDGALACGISVQSTPSSRMLGAASDDFAGRMDAIQYEIDDGPCLTCLREGITVFVDDIPHDPRWPAFAQRGREEGAGTSLSVPMRAGAGTIGALNLYARNGTRLGEADRDRAQQFADQAAGAVALAVRLAEREEQARHLENALRSRSTIDQALGIVMGATRISAAEAFEVLRVRSQHTNQKLRDVAAQIIAEFTQAES